MMLTAASGGRALDSSAEPGSEIALHFSVATPEGQKHFRTQATVARWLESKNGVGVQFPTMMPQDAFDALMQYSVAAGMAAPGDTGSDEDGPAAAHDTEIPDHLLRDNRLDAKVAKALRNKLRALAEKATTKIVARFLADTREDLLSRSRDAGTNAMQSMYFEGLNRLEDSSDQLLDDFRADIVRQIDHVSDLNEVLERKRRRETSSSGQLELVDTDQFEEWLAIAEIISKTENRFADVLLDVRAQLGLIAKPWTNKEVVPVGPSVLVWAFNDALKRLDLRRQVKQDIFNGFERTLARLLGNVYAAVNKILADSGAFPSVEDLRHSLQESMVRRSASGVRVQPEDYQEMDTALRETTMAAEGVGTRPRVDHNPFSEPERPRAFDTARNILDVNRQTQEQLGVPMHDIVAPPDAPDTETYSKDEILDALRDIERRMGAQREDGSLRDLLAESLKSRFGDSKAFTASDYDDLGVVEGLVSSIQQDAFLTDGIRGWLRRLEYTLNKVAAREPDFLRQDPENPHGVIQMLNQLARLGNATDVRHGIDRDVGRQVDDLLTRVVEEYDTNPDVIGEVVGELNPLVDKQARSYRANVERTVRASEGQQKLARARRAVVRAVEDRFGNREIPEVLLELITPGWRNLMVHAHLREGENSNGWRDALGVLDQLAGQLSGAVTKDADDYVDPELLMSRVSDGLESISFDPAKRTPLTSRLESALRETSDVGPMRPMADVKDMLGLDGVLPEVEPSPSAIDDTEKASWERALERARRMQVGEWVATSDRQNRPVILTIAFVGDDHASFILVNRKGVKASELTLQEMADALYNGNIKVLADYDLPLTERASQRMLENMHNQLAHQATHDDLTQLLNRKEFERLVDEAVAKAHTSDEQHALYYLDLDQFKIVNNTSGHTAGDALLRQVAGALNQSLEGRDATVARLGGDEFGVLARRIHTAAARDLAKELLAVVRAERFTWDEREYTLSTSMGLVFIDQATENVDTIMHHADDACYAAKDAGRNRCQEYEVGDRDLMARHGVMEWVTELDKALKEDRLVLNCQRIQPIGASADDTDAHFEILLTMIDQNGQIVPPAEFIMAAETYNRMTDIDRWVVRNVLQWMAEHRDYLDHFSGFAINVSGQSLTDENFADFVLEQFAETHAPTSKVCFEVTETAAIGSLDNAIDFMNRMKIIGCQFSLDDFGTGMSSYSYLRNLPVDFVKIDGVFVKHIDENPGDFAVVRSINEIGHYMGKKTIAEFVENEAIVGKLNEIGVDYAQGYHIQRPTPLNEFRLVNYAAAVGSE